MSHEGYVLVSGWDKDERSFARIKVKSPSYVALAHLKEGMSAKRLLEIIKNNESEEFLSYFPEFRPEYEDVEKKYETILQELSLLYSENKNKDLSFPFFCSLIAIIFEHREISSWCNNLKISICSQNT